jgi:hypothetical protein
MELPARAYGTIGRCENRHRGGTIQRRPIGQRTPAASLPIIESHHAHRSPGRICIVRIMSKFIVTRVVA